MQQVMLPGYLGVAGIPLLRGRDVSDEDINERRDVAVVDERFARMLSSSDPLGRQFHVGSGMFEVIGVTPRCGSPTCATNRVRISSSPTMCARRRCRS